MTTVTYTYSVLKIRDECRACFNCEDYCHCFEEEDKDGTCCEYDDYELTIIIPLTVKDIPSFIDALRHPGHCECGSPLTEITLHHDKPSHRLDQAQR